MTYRIDDDDNDHTISRGRRLRAAAGVGGDASRNHGPLPAAALLYLPNEVLAAVVHASRGDRPTLAALLAVCRATYDLAAPFLYGDLCITESNLGGVLRGLMARDTCAPIPPKCVYPTSKSDTRKRALLAFTKTLRVRSVPRDCAMGRCSGSTDSGNGGVGGGGGGGCFRVCPMDKATFPAVMTVLVSTTVPYHHDLNARRLGRVTPTSSTPSTPSSTPSPRSSP